MTTTPHHIGQVTKAEILVAHVIETAPADATPERVATVAVQQLQDAGWTPPRDLTEHVPLRPEQPASDAAREAAMAEIRAVFTRPTRTTNVPQ